MIVPGVTLQEKDIAGFLPLHASEMRNYARHKERQKQVRTARRAL